MAINDKEVKLSKQKIARINRDNRNISGNLNSLMDELHTMTYNIQRTDKIDTLSDKFNNLLNNEISDITKRADGDTSGFLVKLFSETNKKTAGTIKDIETIFNTEEGQLQSFILEQYKNRMLRQGDLHEIASQLVELQQAITITRDAIISPDVITGHMSRNLTIENNENAENSYIPIIEEIEKKFKLQEKIKNFIIPKSLEYGEYYMYVIPYAKLFEDFEKEKMHAQNTYKPFAESAGITLDEYLSKEKHAELDEMITESVQQSDSYRELQERTEINESTFKKDISNEVDQYLKNITVCNAPIPLSVLEEGVESSREYYTEFVEQTITEDSKNISFSNIMSNIDNGVHDIFQKTSKSGNKRKNSYGNIKDCYTKLIDPVHLLPIEIMDEVIGYYYIQEEDITPLSGILTSTMYYDKFDSNRNENNALSMIAETIVGAFDKKFLDKNIKFKKLIVEALNYYKLNNRKIRFQFIPKEYILSFKINQDEHGNGVSILEPSLFYAKLYLMLLLFKMMSIILNSNDSKINYIKQSGIEANVANKIQEIARIKQQRRVTMADMFSYTTLINKIGQGSEMYIPVGKSDTKGIETEVLSGQDVQLNTDLMEMLKKAYVSGTGVPDVLMNYTNEADFAKTLELANNRFQGRVVSFQLDYNEQITAMYKAILKSASTIPEDVIEAFSFNFVQPKYNNGNVTNDLLNNHNTLQEFLIPLFYGQEGLDDPELIPKINKFKQGLARERLSMLQWNKIDELFKSANIDGTEDLLNPDKKTDEG